MTAKLSKQAFDVGVVTGDVERALAFYRDTLGLPKDSEAPFPGVGTLHRLRVGESFFKLFAPERPPTARVPGGGLSGALGFRYVTFWLENLDETVEACRRFGAKIATEPRPLRPGVRVAFVEDPEGNLLELLGA